MIAAYNNLAALMRDRGQFEEAQLHYEKALHLAELHSRPDDRIIAVMLNGLAESLLATGRVGEAEMLLRRVLAVLENTADKDDAEVSRARRNLKSLFKSRRKTAKSEDGAGSEAAFDVFISYDAINNRPMARHLAERLRGRGLHVWFDEWELILGDSWLEVLGSVLASVASVVICIGPSGRVPAEESVGMDHELKVFKHRGTRVIPVLLPGSPQKPSLPPWLHSVTWIDLRDGITEEGIDRLEWGITGRKPLRLLSDDGDAQQK